MNRSKCCLFICILMLVVNRSFGQETLIDVPSLEIVGLRELSFQAQGVLTKDGVNTSLTVGYGLGNDFEVGIFVYQLVFQKAKGVEIDPANPEFNPDFLLHAQKGFAIEDWLKLGLGTRSGVSAARSHQKTRFVNFDYVNTQFTIGEAEHKIIVGGYYANEAYIGSGTNFGIMGGIDIVIMKDALHFIGDFISGNSSASIMNAGLEFELPKDWKITLGAQFPFPGSNNENGAAIQISKN